MLVAVQYLQGHGWFESEVEFFINGLDPYDEIHARGWKSENGSGGEWGIPERVDMAFYLEDAVGELEAEGKEYSKEWYYAKVSQLYFSDVEIPDVAMTIGILLAQLWWRADFGDVAERGQANSETLHKANSVRKERSKVQSADRNRVVSTYWFEALAEFGAETMRRDSNAAQAIYAIAMRKRPKELLVKASGEVIGVEAIRKRISALRKLGKVGYTYEAAADVLGVTIQTMRGWRALGLAVLVSQRPHLILGHELKRFLESRMPKARRKLAPDEFYCMSCRAPRDPYPFCTTFCYTT